MSCPRCGNQTFVGAELCWTCHTDLKHRSAHEVGHARLPIELEELAPVEHLRLLRLLGATLGLSGVAALLSVAIEAWLPSVPAVAPILAVPVLLGAFLAYRSSTMAAVGMGVAWLVTQVWASDFVDPRGLFLLAASTIAAAVTGGVLGWLAAHAPAGLNPYRIMPTFAIGIAALLVLVASIPAAGLVRAKAAEMRWVEAAWCSVTLSAEEAARSAAVGGYDAMRWSTTMQRVGDLEELVVNEAPDRFAAAAAAFAEAGSPSEVAPGDAAGLTMRVEGQTQALRDHRVPQLIDPCSG